ncbi:unnamed protein product [Calicophoron daubneyi]|uniref:Lysosomal dipeptide transporter MFSD1 n=1 Tax=Calicophoron daubneyi TaxID=300641 RepID=A0AAV2T2P0_CALDB
MSDTDISNLIEGNEERHSDAEIVRQGCGGTLCCDPARRLHRYVMLIFICFLSFGDYLCYDSPAALQDVMLSDLSITATEFMNFYAFVSWPNVIMCFIGGFLVDRVFGIARGALVFSSIVFGGQLLFGIGAFINSYPLMCFARFFYGTGSESLGVCQNTYTSLWFPPSELNFVFGLQLSMSRAGSTLTMNIMHPIYEAIGKHFGITGTKRLGATLWVGCAFCLYSCICCLMLYFFTKRADRELKAQEARYSGRSETEEAEKIVLKDIIHFPVEFWIISVICVAFYVTVFPFISLGLVFFERKFYLSVTDAALVNSLVYIISAAASPVFGAAIDFTGRNLYWVFTSVGVVLGCHLCFAFTSGQIPPLVLMIIMGFGYSILASSLWPLVSYLLPLHQRGTAYGLMQCVQNLGLAVIAIVAGYLVDNKGYLFLEVFFLFWLSLAMAGTFLLYVLDSNKKRLLNMSGKERRAMNAVEVEKKATPTTSEDRLRPESA